MYTNNSYIVPNPSNLQKSNVTKIFWFKVEGWYFKHQQLWCHEPEPIKAHVIYLSRDESIKMRNYLLPLVNHQSLTDMADLFFFTVTDCDWPIKIKILTTSRLQGGPLVKCLSTDWNVCDSNLCHSTLLWRWALHVHLAPAAHITIMLLRPVK